jgi:hypothetical protein
MGWELGLPAGLFLLKLGIFFYASWRFDQRCRCSKGWQKSLWWTWKMRRNFLNFSDLPKTEWGNFVGRMRIYDFVWNCVIAFVFVFLFVFDANHHPSVTGSAGK